MHCVNKSGKYIKIRQGITVGLLDSNISGPKTVQQQKSVSKFSARRRIKHRELTVADDKVYPIASGSNIRGQLTDVTKHYAAQPKAGQQGGWSKSRENEYDSVY